MCLNYFVSKHLPKPLRDAVVSPIGHLQKERYLSEQNIRTHFFLLRNFCFASSLIR